MSVRLQPVPPELEAHLEQMAADMRATIEREGPELTRRHHEAKRLEAKRQRKLERRETIRFWADIAGAVAPWLTVPAAVVAVVATITHAL